MRVMGWIGAAWLAFLCASPTVAQQVTRYDAMDFPGNDIDDLVGPARSYDDCAQRCVSDGRCGAFTYNLNNGTCIPKSSGESPQRNGRAMSGIVTRPQPGYGGGNVRGIARYDATDFPGADIEDLVGRARSYDDCAQRCLADGRCGAFTYNLNNGNCIPKASAAQAERNDRAVSGIVRGGGGRPGYGPGHRPDSGLPVTRYDATDFPSNDLPDAVGEARSYEDCARRCLADGRCAGFTFNLNNGACIPKSAVVAPQRNDRAVSGVVQRAPAERVPSYGAPTGGVSSCSVGGTNRCPGCSTSCSGQQRAACTPPVEGAGGYCLREAECRCAPN